MKRLLGALIVSVGLLAVAPPVHATVTYTVTSKSGLNMYTDLGNGLDATYLVFSVSADANVSDVWLKLDASGSSIISNVGSGVHRLKFKPASGAHGTDPDPETGLLTGTAKQVFFLVKATATTNTNQPLVVRIFDGDPSGSGNEQATATFNFKVLDTIQANANKVNTVITIPNNPTIGQLGKITVTGCTGTVGAGKVLYFSPVSSDNWPADSFEFVDSDIQIDNYAGSPYRGVALIPTADVLTTDNCYDEIFTFQIDAVGNATTSPSNFITSGGSNVKHTTNSSGSFTVSIPPAECPTITVASIPATLPPAVVGEAYDATFTASPLPTGTYSFSSSNLPAWLTLNSATGDLSGIPTINDVGSVSFTVVAEDSGDTPAGCTGQAQFSFSVACAPFTITSSPATLPPAIAGTPYSATFSTSAFGTFTYSGTGLPAWATLSPGGVLSGTPTASDVGPVSFTVVATNTGTKCVESAPFGFAVDPAAAQVPTLDGFAMAILAMGLAGAAFTMIRRG